MKRRQTVRRAAAACEAGAALLVAMLTVALVATLSSAVLWQQWRALEVETAQQTRQQAQWVLDGALDWARLILSEDGRRSGADHLGEPWAVPLAPVRLGAFLAADKSDALSASSVEDAVLSGQIVDLQARLNLRNLVRDGQVHRGSQAAFARLFGLLGLPQSQLEDLIRALLAADAATRLNPGPTTSPAPSLLAGAALWPQDLSQLLWLGVPSALLQKLQAFVTLLPEATPVNLNTASAQVLLACVDGLDLAQAERWRALRQTTPWENLSQVRAIAGRLAVALEDDQHSVSSRYFQINGVLQIHGTRLALQSVVRREGRRITTLAYMPVNPTGGILHTERE